MYVTVKIREDVLKELRKIQGMFMAKSGKRVTLSDVIEMLIKHYNRVLMTLDD